MMKTPFNMKSYYLVLFLLCFICMTFASCNTRSNESTSNKETTDSIDKDSPQLTVDKLGITDADTRTLMNQVELLSKKINQSEKTIEKLQSQISEIGVPDGITFYISLIALLLSIIALIISYISSKTKNEHTDISKEIEDKLRYYVTYTELQQRLRDLNNKAAGVKVSQDIPDVIFSKINDYENRIFRIETQLRDLSDLNNSNRNINESESTLKYSKTNANLERKKICYANMNNENLFLIFFDTRQDSSVYKIEYDNGGVGTFDLISLEKIKSRNGVNDVVEYQGDCTLEEANSYTPIEFGKCEKMDENTWKVVNKLKIKISK